MDNHTVLVVDDVPPVFQGEIPDLWIDQAGMLRRFPTHRCVDRSVGVPIAGLSTGGL